jgi:hypothetical protein
MSFVSSRVAWAKLVRPCLKTKIQDKGTMDIVAQVAECLPSMCTVFSSPVWQKKKKNILSKKQKIRLESLNKKRLIIKGRPIAQKA